MDFLGAKANQVVEELAELVGILTSKGSFGGVDDVGTFFRAGKTVEMEAFTGF